MFKERIYDPDKLTAAEIKQLNDDVISLSYSLGTLTIYYSNDIKIELDNSIINKLSNLFTKKTRMSRMSYSKMTKLVSIPKIGKILAEYDAIDNNTVDEILNNVEFN